MSIANLYSDNNKSYSLAKVHRVEVDVNSVTNDELSFISNRQGANKLLIQSDRDNTAGSTENSFIALTKGAGNAMVMDMRTDAIRHDLYSANPNAYEWYINGQATNSNIDLPTVTQATTIGMSLDISGLSILGGSPFNYVSQSLSQAISGPFLASTINIEATKIGNFVSLNLSNHLQINNATTFITIAALPSQFRPSATQQCEIFISNGGALATPSIFPGNARIQADGTILIYGGANLGLFNKTGESAGLPLPQTVTYTAI